MYPWFMVDLYILTDTRVRFGHCAMIIIMGLTGSVTTTDESSVKRRMWALLSDSDGEYAFGMFLER